MRNDLSRQTLGVIRLVREEKFSLQAINQSPCGDAVMHMATGEQQTDRVAQGIDGSMNFRRQTAATAPDGLGVAPPFPPAECWCARMYVPSIRTDSRSASWASSSKISRHTDDLDHALKRLYTVCHGPNSCGKSRHGAPVRRIQMMPLRTVRASWAGLPRRSWRAGQTRGSIRFQVSVVRSCRLMWRACQDNQNCLEVF